jgi:hypothetical protein
MSSISASDKKRHNDEVRNQREEYQNRETEQSKRHKREMKRLLEQQDKEVAELTEGYENKIQNIKKRSSEQLTARDQENNAKIDKLRATYLETIRRKTDDSNLLRETEKENLTNQINKERQIHEQQQSLLKSNFDATIADKNRQYESLNERSKIKLKDSIDENAQRLATKHKSEIQLLSEERDRKILQAARENKQTRTVLEGRLKDQKLHGDLQMDRAQINWQTVLKSKEEETAVLMDGRSQALKLERERMQGRYRELTEAKLAEMDAAKETLKSEVASRMERDVRAAESENRRIQNDNMVRLMTTNRIRDLERGHIIVDYEKRLKDLAAVKSGLFEKAKEVNAERIARLGEQNSAILQKQTERFRSDQIITNERHAEDRARVQMEHKAQLSQMGNRTDNRVNKLIKSTSNAQKAQLKLHSENMDQMKNSFQSELSNQRQAQLEVLKDVNMRMADKIKSTEKKYEQKLETTVNNYEEKITQLKEQHEKELRRQAESFESRMKAERKAQQADAKSQDMKFDVKLSQLKEQHDKEIEILEKRHQEQVASLGQKMSYYRKNS